MPYDAVQDYRIEEGCLLSPPTSCVPCTALFLCLKSPLLDETGQRHLFADSALAADLPRLRQHWFWEDVREYRAYAARGEVAEFQAARSLYEHGWRWVWWVPNMPYGEYVYELDGCPWEDAEGLSHLPDWFAPARGN